MAKKQLYLLGLITLLVFPLPAYFALLFFDHIEPKDFLQFDHFLPQPILIGILFGVFYGILAIYILKAPIFKRIPLRIDRMVKDLKLTYIDAVFLSLCAGIGEELLFRAGVQTYLGIWATSIIFVAIHGYISLKKPLMSLYGLVVLPFIIVISYGFNTYGLWFSIASHFAYDLILFISMIKEKE